MMVRVRFLGVVLVVLAGCSSQRIDPLAIDVPAGWPVAKNKATITSPFGARRGRGAHQGLDLAAPSGTPVRACAGGRIRSAGRSGDFGRLVVIDHGGGWQTLYAHLKRIEVKKGQRIARGALVGTVGKSGNASGYHLHYEIRYDGRAVDPGATLRR